MFCRNNSLLLTTYAKYLFVFKRDSDFKENLLKRKMSENAFSLPNWGCETKSLNQHPVNSKNSIWSHMYGTVYCYIVEVLMDFTFSMQSIWAMTEKFLWPQEYYTCQKWNEYDCKLHIYYKFGLFYLEIEKPGTCLLSLKCITMVCKVHERNEVASGLICLCLSLFLLYEELCTLQ